MNRVINGGCFGGPQQEAGETPLFVTLFATRSVGAEATTGLAANGHMMMVGESGGESLSTPTPAPRVAAPSGNCFAIGGYAYAALQMSAVEEAVEEARKQDGFVCWWLFGGGWRRKSGTESGGKRRRREIESEMKAK